MFMRWSGLSLLITVRTGAAEGIKAIGLVQTSSSLDNIKFSYNKSRLLLGNITETY
jgi:hypothetical protein